MKVVDIEPLIEFYEKANGEDLDKDMLLPEFIQNMKSLPSLEGDQSAKADGGKTKLTLVPRDIIWAIAKVREYGTGKYGDPENWKRVEIQRYRDAAFRHFLKYLDDPTGTDEDSCLPHLWHLACNIAFLCTLEDDALREEIERVENAS